jgi:hypothetical protein
LQEYISQSNITLKAYVKGILTYVLNRRYNTGADPGGGVHSTRAPGARPPKIGKNMIFWRKIVIFSHEIPQKCSRLPPLGAILLSAKTGDLFSMS